MTTAAPIRVFVADDHPVVIDGLAALCADVDDVTIVGSVTRIHALRPALQVTAFDVLVIDVVKLGGVALLEELVAAYPVAVVLYTDLMDVTAPLLAAGAAGYASKHDRVATLVEVLRAVRTGGAARSPEAEDCWQWYIVKGKRAARPPKNGLGAAITACRWTRTGEVPPGDGAGREKTMDDGMRVQPATPRPPSRRVVLWDALEQVHAQLGMAPPTATLTIEDLEAEVERLRVQAAAEPGAATDRSDDPRTAETEP